MDRENEYKYDWIKVLDNEKIYPDTFNEEELNNRDINDLYFDQAPYKNCFEDRCFSSVFLKHGLKCLEGWMIQQILNGSEYSKEQLEYMIRRNPHLHNVFKTNLIQNLLNK